MQTDMCNERKKKKKFTDVQKVQEDKNDFERRC